MLKDTIDYLLSDIRFKKYITDACPAITNNGYYIASLEIYNIGEYIIIEEIITKTITKIHTKDFLFKQLDIFISVYIEFMQAYIKLEDINIEIESCIRKNRISDMLSDY